MSTGGAPAGLAAAAQHMAATAAAAAGGGGGGGGGAASAAAAPFIIPAGCAGATPPVADLQAVNIVHQHLVMTWRIPRRSAPTLLSAGSLSLFVVVHCFFEILNFLSPF